MLYGLNNFSICYERKDFHIETECKHIFCLDCIIGWKYQFHNNTRPYCRQELKLKYYKIF